ncbi:MAG: hypothetical protein E7256_16410 [Lachnospiraceae bacterium]|nr:hypothetical protein [Lachnospiraceae bacterium]
MKEKFNMVKPASMLFPYIVASAATAVVFFFTDYMWVAVLASAISVLLILVILIGIAIELKQDDCIHNKVEKKNDIVAKKKLPR